MHPVAYGRTAEPATAALAAAFALLVTRQSAAAPSVTIAAPVDQTVVRGATRFAGSCANCVSLELHRDDPNGTVLAAGVTNVDITLDFPTDDGKQVPLVFVAKDAAGAQTAVWRSTYVEHSTRLVEIEAVPGAIKDIDPTRILWTDDAGAYIRTRGTNIDTRVGPSGESLTDQGAIWSEGEWDGVATQPNNGGFLDARGSWAVAVRPDPTYPGSGQVFVKNLVTGGETPILYPTSTADGAVDVDLGENGVVGITRYNTLVGRQVYWWRGGVLMI